jgi:hypothetical protein
MQHVLLENFSKVSPHHIICFKQDGDDQVFKIVVDENSILIAPIFRMCPVYVLVHPIVSGIFIIKIHNIRGIKTHHYGIHRGRQDHILELETMKLQAQQFPSTRILNS